MGVEVGTLERSRAIVCASRAGIQAAQ